MLLVKKIDNNLFDFIFLSWTNTETTAWKAHHPFYRQKLIEKFSLTCVLVILFCVAVLSFLAASQVEGLPPRVLLTITKLQCMLESKQERIAALERQVEDLMQDRKFLRSQIENLTSNRSMPAFAAPSPVTESQ